MSKPRDVAPVTVLSGATVSSSFRSQMRAGSYQIPAAFTGTNCSVHGSIDNTTFTAVRVEGNESATETVAAGGTYALPVKSVCYKYLRFVVDAQAADRSIAIFTRDDS